MSKELGCRKMIYLFLEGLGVGAVSGILWATYRVDALTEPHRIYHADVSGDGIKDIVIQNVRENKYVFLGQKDGSYKKLDDVLEQEKQVRESLLMSTRRFIEKNVEELK